MNLLLTGAGGFFGSNLLDLLLGRTPHTDARTPEPNGRPEIHLLQRSAVDVGSATIPSPDRSPGPGSGEPVGRDPSSAVFRHRVDLFDEAAVAEAIDRIRPTHLCHLAWLGPETDDRYRSPANDRWVDASKRLFRAFRDGGGRRLVHLGSCIEYGNAATGVRSESQPLDPDTAYGRAKAELSQYLAGLEPDLSTAVARPFFCYGPHEQPDRLVSSLINALAADRSIDLTEGRQRRDYLDARDVAAALWSLLESEATGAFNIGSGQAVEVRTIAETLGRIAGRPELLNFGARPEGADTAEEIVADIGRITSATGWRPTIGLERGLEETTEWWLQRLNTDRSSGGKRK